MNKLPWIRRHRRFTANHTWHLDWMGRQLFVKANPHRSEARAEHVGHARIRPYYRVPRLHNARRAGQWTVLVYDRWPHLGTDHGLLLDTITRAETGPGTGELDCCLRDLVTTYRRAIDATLRRVPGHQTVGKLYGDRVVPGGRLDQYYRAGRPWPLLDSGGISSATLSDLPLIVNGRRHWLDVTGLLTDLRAQFNPVTPVWAAVTQGDPTDFNVGWTRDGGPVWFDYDTGGLNALAGEFACFLVYQRLHGAWLTPAYDPAAFRDHPAAVFHAARSEPAVQVRRSQDVLVIDYEHRPPPGRRHVMRRYLDELVEPTARHLGIDDLMDWLRPYLVLRLIGVYDLTRLDQRDAALSVALLAQVLEPSTTLTDFLALTPTSNGA